MSEITHTLQHLMNQASADTNFLANLRGVLEHHATKIDTVQREKFDYEEETNTLTGQMREVLAMIERNDGVVKKVIEDNHSRADGSLRGDVQSEVEKMNARMNEIIKTAAGGNPIDAQHVHRLQEIENNMANLQLTVAKSISEMEGRLKDGQSRITVEMRNMGDAVAAANVAAKEAMEAAREAMNATRRNWKQMPQGQAQAPPSASAGCPTGSEVPASHRFQSGRTANTDGFPVGGGGAPTGGNFPTGGGGAGPCPSPGAQSQQQPDRGYFAGCGAPHASTNDRQAPGSAPQSDTPHGYPPRTGYFNMYASDGEDQSRPSSRQWFEDKVAQSPQYLYDSARPKAWAKLIRNYLMGRRWEMKDLLSWAEAFQRETITQASIEGYGLGEHMQDTSFSVTQASSQLWTFLNLNVGLVGEARTKFEQAKELNGLDVWRRIVAPLEPKTVARRVAMHTDIHAPAKAKKLSETADHITAWEKELEKYYQMDGQQIVMEEKCVILLKMLPVDTPGWLGQTLEDINDFDAMRAKLEKQITFLSEHSGSHSVRVNLVSGEAPSHPTDEPGGGETLGQATSGYIVDLTHLSCDAQDAVLAVMRNNGFRGRVRTGKTQAPRANTPPRTMVGAATGLTRPAKCGNCGGEHATKDCTEPLLPTAQRKCFNCDEPGHQSRDCPHPRRAGPKAKAKAKAKPGFRAANLVDESLVTCLMCEDEDGFRPVRHRQRQIDLACYRAIPAGLSQKQRRAQPPTAQNLFHRLPVDEHDSDDERLRGTVVHHPSKSDEPSLVAVDSDEVAWPNLSISCNTDHTILTNRMLSENGYGQIGDEPKVVFGSDIGDESKVAYGNSSGPDEASVPTPEFEIVNEVLEASVNCVQGEERKLSECTQETDGPEGSEAKAERENEIPPPPKGEQRQKKGKGKPPTPKIKFAPQMCNGACGDGCENRFHERVSGEAPPPAEEPGGGETRRCQSGYVFSREVRLAAIANFTTSRKSTRGTPTLMISPRAHLE